MYTYVLTAKSPYSAAALGILRSATPNPPTKIIPIKICGLKTFREVPYGPGNSTP